MRYFDYLQLFIGMVLSTIFLVPMIVLVLVIWPSTASTPAIESTPYNRFLEPLVEQGYFVTQPNVVIDSQIHHFQAKILPLNGDTGIIFAPQTINFSKITHIPKPYEQQWIHLVLLHEAGHLYLETQDYPWLQTQNAFLNQI